MAFRKKNNNKQTPRVDRFVASRDSLDAMRKRRPLRELNTIAEIWDKKYLIQKKYMCYFDTVLGLSTNLEEVQPLPPWPCVPRRRKHLIEAENILDLPTYSHATFPHVLDWCKDNVLVAALGRKYYNWSWRTQKLITWGLSQHTIHCCKFDPTGKLLALGTEGKIVEIHDTVPSTLVSISFCQCKEENCIRTTLDWSPTGQAFAAGCTGGFVTACDRTNKYIKWKRITNQPILNVRVSPDSRYVAVASMNATSVLILSWPTLTLYSSVESAWTIHTIAWHPWRSALLGVGAVTDLLKPIVCMLDTPPRRTRDAVVIAKHPCAIDGMLFSHRTGELVLSLWGKHGNPDGSNNTASSYISHLVVMSDGNTVVDHWSSNRSDLDRIRTMVFSPDGTKLATATADEDLIIYNFLPEDKTTSPKRNKRFFAIPAYLDETSPYGFCLR